MADASSWESTLPSGSSEIRKGDDLLRSQFSIAEATWEEEHFFVADNSGASAGEHRPGSSRISYGNGPAGTSGDEGRLFYDVDDNELVAQGSSATTSITGHAGAKVVKTNTQALPDVSNSDISWESAEWDQGGFFTLSDGSSTSFRVPSGQSGFYRISVGIGFQNPAGFGGTDEISVDTLDLAIEVNGALGTEVRDSRFSGQAVQINAVEQLQEDDTVGLRLFQRSGSDQTVKPANENTWFSLSKL